MIWLGFLIFGVTLVAKLNFDYWQYLNKNKIHHAVEATAVTALLVWASYYSGWIAVPMFFFSFWVFFDGMFNVATGQKWGRIGETAKLDILQRRYQWIVWAKYIGAVLSILLFIFKDKMHFVP